MTEPEKDQVASSTPQDVAADVAATASADDARAAEVVADAEVIEANEAASYVQELSGDDANIIFGAMYDESTPDTCSITVIATGLEAQESAGQTSTFMKKANERPAFNSGASSFKTSAPTQRTPITKSETTVGTSTIQIPSFLQKK